MDIGTLIGIFLALGLILMGMGSFVTAFIDITSMFIVLGGTLGAILIFFPLENLMGLGGW